MNHRHETTDMEPKYVAYFGIILAAVIVAVSLGLWVMFDLLVEQEAAADLPPSVVMPDRTIPPEPRLDVNSENTAPEKLRIDRETLDRYEWSDRPNGRARIPIDRAMDIIAERGLQ